MTNESALTRLAGVTPERLGNELRRVRLSADPPLTGQALADRLGWVGAKVTRTEKANTILKPGEIRAWVDACGADTATADRLVEMREVARLRRAGWRRLLTSGGQVQVQIGFNDLASATKSTTLVETAFVPGFAQIEGYAAAVLDSVADIHGTDPGEVAEAVETRLQRAAHLDDPEKRFEFVIAESVLQWRLCPADVMREQLLWLAELAARPNVDLVIVGFGRDVETPPEVPFGMYDGSVIVETPEGIVVLDDPDEVAPFEALLDVWRRVGVTGGGAVALIEAAAQQTGD